MITRQKNAGGPVLADAFTAFAAVAFGAIAYVADLRDVPLICSLIGAAFALRGVIRGVCMDRAEPVHQSVTGSTVHGDSVQISGHRGDWRRPTA